MKTKSGGGGDFPIPPAGLTPARCVRVIDLGSHKMDDRFTKGETRYQRKVQIAFELPEFTMELHGKTVMMMVSRRYTASHDQRATLRQHLESWYAQKFDDRELEATGGFDLSKLLGRGATLNLIHSKDGKYANIEGIMPLMKGCILPAQENPSLDFDLDNIVLDAWDRIPAKTKEFIAESEDVKSGKIILPGVKSPGEIPDDEVPF